MFYLPVVTPWWFTNIVFPLIKVMARDHEVHVLVPPLWRNTGIGPDQRGLIAQLPQVFWHLLDGPGHPNLRHDASEAEDLIEVINQINPHLTLCRSADIKTPQKFPGTVRYIMEAAAPPLSTAPECVWLAPTLFDHGMMPELSAQDAALLDQFAAPLWAALTRANAPTDREAFLKDHRLPSDKSIIGLPLEYEHEENFFNAHHHFASNAALVEHLLSKLREQHILAITHHPLTELYGDVSAIEKVVAQSGGKAILLPSSAKAGSATSQLAEHCDGMIVGNSKSWSVCTYWQKPILRLSGFATGRWVRAYSSVREFLADIKTGDARRPIAKDMERWLAYHLTNCLINPNNPSLTADDLIQSAIQTVPTHHWAGRVEHVMDHPLEPAL